MQCNANAMNCNAMSSKYLQHPPFQSQTKHLQLLSSNVISIQYIRFSLKFI